MFRLLALALVGVTIAAPPVFARERCGQAPQMHPAGCVDVDTVMASDLQLSGARIDAMEQGTTNANAHLTILNRGKTSDRLLGATSPVARIVELHGEKRIDPGETVEFRPGGLEIELSDVDGRLRPGAQVDILLLFEKAGAVVMPFSVRDSRSAAAIR